METGRKSGRSQVEVETSRVVEAADAPLGASQHPEHTERPTGPRERSQAAPGAPSEAPACLASVAAERDCLAMAVMFALQWKPDAPIGLREGLEEILATMPTADTGVDFFRPGRTYVNGKRTFKAVTVAETPRGTRVALGFSSDSGGIWVPDGEYELDRWTEAAESGAVPA